MNKYSPILITTLNRYNHLHRCITSLSSSTLSIETDLFIALDFPSKEQHWDGYLKICSYLETITSFKSLTIIKRSENYGASRNFEEAKRLIFKKYDRLIFTEDDNEFSNNFIHYMNFGLDHYIHDSQIFAICGYFFALKKKSNKNAMIPLNAFSAWGYGIWKDREDSIRKCLCRRYVLRSQLSITNLIAILYKRFSLLDFLTSVNNHGRINYDGIVEINLALSNRKCIFPTVSKVRNFGFDGTGENCPRMETNEYFFQDIDLSERTEFLEEKSEIFNLLLKEHFKTDFKQKIILIIKYLISLKEIIN